MARLRAGGGRSHEMNLAWPLVTEVEQRTPQSSISALTEMRRRCTARTGRRCRWMWSC